MIVIKNGRDCVKNRSITAVIIQKLEMNLFETKNMILQLLQSNFKIVRFIVIFYSIGKRETLSKENNNSNNSDKKLLFCFKNIFTSET